MARILVIDDDDSLREVVRFILTEAGHEVLTAGDGTSGLAQLDAEPDVVITDVQMPGPDGLEVLRRISTGDNPDAPPVILLTAHGSVQQAVQAMQTGAYTYLLKPFARDELRLTVEQAAHLHSLERDNLRLRGLLHSQRQGSDFVYRSETMERFLTDLRQVAGSDACVLLGGESGTGKELAARACHNLSPRWDQAFVAVNCAALPAELLESELFGHAKGAFTGAARSAMGKIRRAAGGTLFLDEIAELPLNLQPKLLRVLEDGWVDPVGAQKPIAVDFRLVCATNRDLMQEVAAGRFREDLLFRINVLHLELPPLRDRPDDIVLLWEHFTEHHSAEPVTSEPALLAELARRHWRGNVRELKNLNQRLVLLRSGPTLTLADLERLAPQAGRSPTGTSSPVTYDGDTTSEPAAGLPLTDLPDEGFSLPDLEKEVIARALAKCDGNRSRAAAYLGIPRHILVYRLQKYGL